ncbi:MAG: tetratricopeptide repeat protein [Candidatus Eremiobacteraeota bacterium]|nr:tetratricopeptide repeat protein [Candidatus Eremiobacteraeota bacterium]
MSNIICKKCNAENEEASRFCGKCGGALASEGIGEFDAPGESDVIGGKYRVESIVHRGETGAVFRARDTESGARVAIKEIILPQDIRRDFAGEKLYFTPEKMFVENNEPGEPGAEKARKKEIINILDKKINNIFHITHKSLPRFIKLFLENGKLHLVTAFVYGQDLQTIMYERKNTPLPQSQVIVWLHQMLDLLDYLHGRYPPIFLCNLKPSHFIVSAGDRVYLADPGLSHFFRSIKKGAMTGIPGFASPEQYKGIVDEKSNIYSLGAIIHYLLTGINPATPELPAFSFEKIKNMNPEVTPGFEALVMKMLEIKPADRPESIHHIMVTLENMKHVLKTPTAFFNHGIASYNKGDYEKAIKQFGRAILLDSDFARPYLWRGMAYENLDNLQKANEDYSRAIDADPAYVSALCKRGSIKSIIGDNNKALDDFNSAILIDPGYAEAFVGRGLVFREVEEFGRAIGDFNRAIDLDPDFDEAYLWRGFANYAVGNYREAIGDLNRSLEINPEYEEAFICRALICHDIGEYEESIEDNNSALDINPDSAMAYCGRGLSYKETGELAQALCDLNMAIEIDPDYNDAYVTRGTLNYELGRDEEALKDFNKAIEIDPGLANTYLKRGEVLERMGRRKEAEMDFRRYKDL